MTGDLPSFRARRSPAAARRVLRVVVLAALLAALPVLQTGCVAVGLTFLGAAVGVSSGTAVGYTLNGFAYRTFAAPVGTVEKATLLALRDMGIVLRSRESQEDGRMLKAEGNDRRIEVFLEPVTQRATRLRTVVRMGPFLKDKATATEIIIQTERVLGDA